MKLPGKDTVTVPWMSQREIPAIKAVLSAWRKLRKDKDLMKTIHDLISLCENLDAYAKTNMEIAAWALEKLAATDERLRKEASK
jgi:hypothetical protein